jgi:hypothetical protein
MNSIWTGAWIANRQQWELLSGLKLGKINFT